MIARLARQVQTPVSAWLVSASALAFLLVAAFGQHGVLPSLCGASLPPAALAWLAQLEWTTFDPLRWMLHWLAMFCAMMLPLLVQPVEHIVRTTLRRRLARSLAAFISSYALAWLPAAMLIGIAATLLQLLLPPAMLVAAMLFGVLAWSASPLAQRARNRSHRLIPLEIRGAKADRDCCRFGLSTGLWCAIACWPWMLLSQAIPGHGPGMMLLVTAALAAERAMPPCAPRWQLPRLFGFLAALRPYRDLGRL